MSLKQNRINKLVLFLLFLILYGCKGHVVLPDYYYTYIKVLINGQKEDVGYFGYLNIGINNEELTRYEYRPNFEIKQKIYNSKQETIKINANISGYDEFNISCAIVKNKMEYTINLPLVSKDVKTFEESNNKTSNIKRVVDSLLIKAEDDCEKAIDPKFKGDCKKYMTELRALKVKVDKNFDDNLLEYNKRKSDTKGKYILYKYLPKIIETDLDNQKSFENLLTNIKMINDATKPIEFSTRDQFFWNPAEYRISNIIGDKFTSFFNKINEKITLYDNKNPLELIIYINIECSASIEKLSNSQINSFENDYQTAGRYFNNSNILIDKDINSEDIGNNHLALLRGYNVLNEIITRQNLRNIPHTIKQTVINYGSSKNRIKNDTVYSAYRNVKIEYRILPKNLIKDEN